MPVPAPQAVLLAAGNASRLAPLTHRRPKGMVLVGGRPVLQHAVEALRSCGVGSLVIVTGAHGERIQAFFKDGADFGLPIRYAHQPQPAGTADAVRRALPLLDPDRPALLLHGHLLVAPATLAPLAKAKGDLALCAPARAAHQQGVPRRRGDRLLGVERATPAVGSTQVLCGLQAASPPFLKALAGPLAGRSDLSDALGAWAADHEVRIEDAAGLCEPIVDPWDVLRIHERVLDLGLPQAARPPGVQGTGPVAIAGQAVVAPTATLIGPVTIGDGSSVGEYSVVGPYVSVRNNTRIGAHCEVRHSILNNNVLVESRSLVRGSILDDGARVGAGFLCEEQSTPEGLRGCILGSDAAVAAGVVLPGGTVLAPEERRARG